MPIVCPCAVTAIAAGFPSNGSPLHVAPPSTESETAQEKDYVLAWLLAARATLGPTGWVFKGRTALRRCYFPGYRYSFAD
jgi:hypothetical protein